MAAVLSNSAFSSWGMSGSVLETTVGEDVDSLLLLNLVPGTEYSVQLRASYPSGESEPALANAKTRDYCPLAPYPCRLAPAPPCPPGAACPCRLPPPPCPAWLVHLFRCAHLRPAEPASRPHAPLAIGHVGETPLPTHPLTSPHPSITYRRPWTPLPASHAPSTSPPCLGPTPSAPAPNLVSPPTTPPCPVPTPPATPTPTTPCVPATPRPLSGPDSPAVSRHSPSQHHRAGHHPPPAPPPPPVVVVSPRVLFVGRDPTPTPARDMSPPRADAPSQAPHDTPRQPPSPPTPPPAGGGPHTAGAPPPAVYRGPSATLVRTGLNWACPTLVNPPLDPSTPCTSTAHIRGPRSAHPARHRVPPRVVVSHRRPCRCPPIPTPPYACPQHHPPREPAGPLSTASPPLWVNRTTPPVLPYSAIWEIRGVWRPCVPPQTISLRHLAALYVSVRTARPPTPPTPTHPPDLVPAQHARSGSPLRALPPYQATLALRLRPCPPCTTVTTTPHRCCSPALCLRPSAPPKLPCARRGLSPPDYRLLTRAHPCGMHDWPLGRSRPLSAPRVRLLFPPLAPAPRFSPLCSPAGASLCPVLPCAPLSSPSSRLLSHYASFSSLSPPLSFLSLVPTSPPALLSLTLHALASALFPPLSLCVRRASPIVLSLLAFSCPYPACVLLLLVLSLFLFLHPLSAPLLPSTFFLRSLTQPYMALLLALSLPVCLCSPSPFFSSVPSRGSFTLPLSDSLLPAIAPPSRLLPPDPTLSPSLSSRPSGPLPTVASQATDLSLTCAGSSRPLPPYSLAPPPPLSSSPPIPFGRPLLSPLFSKLRELTGIAALHGGPHWDSGSPQKLSTAALHDSSPRRLSTTALHGGSPQKLSTPALHGSSPQKLSTAALHGGSPQRLSTAALHGSPPRQLSTAALHGGSPRQLSTAALHGSPPRQPSTAALHGSFPRQSSTAALHGSSPRQLSTAALHGSSPRQLSTAALHGSSPRQLSTAALHGSSQRQLSTAALHGSSPQA
uniref:Fibronectin type-III domain-containing protein n=1 Tax=Knipowitschia caucasica TaxID=637954 RepID=A0AAV2L4E4_KNICA